MKRLLPSIRQPVQRQSADWYILITLLSFASSVILTRLFLQLTGYPQLGGGEFHIAHVLWGGLLLFIASLLPLVFANRWALTIDAILSGMGVGLFIDEVGKFITTTNNYFYPLAAPIIYAFFLLTVMLYQQIKRPYSRNARAELYRVVDALEEILENDLDQIERKDMEDRLKYIADSEKDPELRRLAITLLEFLSANTLYTAPIRSSWVKKLLDKFTYLDRHYLSKNKLRAALSGGLFALGIVAFFNIYRALPYGTGENLRQLLSDLYTSGMLSSFSSLNWLLARLAMESTIGLLLIISGGLLLSKYQFSGLVLGSLALLLSLTTVNLLLFYFDQFSTIITALIQFIIFIGIRHYRQKYLPVPPKAEAAKSNGIWRILRW